MNFFVGILMPCSVCVNIFCHFILVFEKLLNSVTIMDSGDCRRATKTSELHRKTPKSWPFIHSYITRPIPHHKRHQSVAEAQQPSRLYPPKPLAVDSLRRQPHCRFVPLHPSQIRLWENGVSWREKRRWRLGLGQQDLFTPPMFIPCLPHV